MNLVIDWGNTFLKTGWFDGANLQEARRYESTDALLADVLPRRPEHVLVSSTSQPAESLCRQLTEVGVDCRVLDSRTPVPVGKAYDTPETLGADRVAAAVGAVALFPGADCLVFDLGTCLTADFVDRNAVFQGGLISPGLRMRLRAMHEQTARLPLVPLPTDWAQLDWPRLDWPRLDWPALTAKNTRQAMLSGVLNGLAFELNGIQETYRRAQPGIVTLVCGADAPAFESRLKPPIFAVPELVLIGLNRILQYNVENLQADTPEVNP